MKKEQELTPDESYQLAKKVKNWSQKDGFTYFGDYKGIGVQVTKSGNLDFRTHNYAIFITYDGIRLGEFRKNDEEFPEIISFYEKVIERYHEISDAKREKSLKKGLALIKKVKNLLD